MLTLLLSTVLLVRLSPSPLAHLLSGALVVHLWIQSGRMGHNSGHYSILEGKGAELGEEGVELALRDGGRVDSRGGARGGDQGAKAVAPAKAPGEDGIVKGQEGVEGDEEGRRQGRRDGWCWRWRCGRWWWSGRSRRGGGGGGDQVGRGRG